MAVAALTLAEKFPDPGRRMVAKATLPRDTFPEADLVVMVAFPPAKKFSDPEEMQMTLAPDSISCSRCGCEESDLVRQLLLFPR